MTYDVQTGEQVAFALPSTISLIERKTVPDIEISENIFLQKDPEVPRETGSDGDNDLTGILVGSIIGGLVLIAVLVSLVVFIVIRRRRREKNAPMKVNDTSRTDNDATTRLPMNSQADLSSKDLNNTANFKDNDKEIENNVTISNMKEDEHDLSAFGATFQTSN